MLSLHSFFKNLLSALFILIIFASCSDRSKTDLAILKLLDESIQSSNQVLLSSSTDILASIQNKLTDVGTAERAKYWHPKAEKIQKLSKDAFDFIESMKPEVDNNAFREVFEKLMDYQNGILQVDSQLTHVFRKSLRLFTKDNDTLKTGQKKLFQSYFNDASDISAIALLSKLQNNIRINEERMLTYCHEQIGIVRFGPCSPDLPIVVQSSTIVQPGEKIEIIAGICSFYTIIEPEVFVYERPIPIRSDGVARSKFIAASKPGKYYVPVKISYTDQEGRQQTTTKEIEYTVAHIQKQ